MRATWIRLRSHNRLFGIIATTVQQFGQLGEIRCNPPRLIACKQIGRRAPVGLVLEIDVGKRLPVAVLHNEAGVVGLLDRPWRRDPAVTFSPVRTRTASKIAKMPGVTRSKYELRNGGR